MEVLNIGKHMYIPARIEITEFESEDIITTSVPDEPIELPAIPIK